MSPASNSIRFAFLPVYVLFLAMVVGWTVWLYWPGLTGPLLLDDYSNLSSLGDGEGVRDWDSFRSFVFGNESGPSGRPVSMLSFLIDAQDWPPHIAAFKYTNIMIHVLIGLVLAWFSKEVFSSQAIDERRSAILGLGVAALWLLHPLNTTTTLYIVQRMTQVMTLFALCSLLCFVKGRTLIATLPGRGLLLLCLALFPFGLLAVLSKENGALLLLLILLCNYCLFDRKPDTVWYRLWLRLGVLLPLGIVVLYLLYSLPDSLARYEFRHFNLVERLLSEARIVTAYIGKILMPNTVGTGLFHDDFEVSHSLIQPLSTLPAVIFVLGLPALAWWQRHRLPMLSFGIGWFFGMHLLESTYLPLELVFEHRNYLAMMGPLITVVFFFNQLAQEQKLARVKKVAVPAAALVLAVMSWLTWNQAKLWGNAEHLFAYWAFEKPDSNRAQIVFADFLNENGNPEAALERLELSHRLHPREVTILLHIFNTACENGLRSPYSLEYILERETIEYSHNDINFHLRELLQHYLSGSCDFPELQVLIALFQRASELPLSENQSGNLHFLFSDVYVAAGELDSALIQLSRAFSFNSDASIPIRQAIISASAFNYDDSLVFLERARHADAGRNPLHPSRLQEIEDMERDIQQILAEQQ